MKLWQRIFLSSLCLIMLAVNVISVTLLNNSHRLSVERERSHAISEYDYLTAAFANSITFEQLMTGRSFADEAEAAEFASDTLTAFSGAQSGAAIYDKKRILLESSGLPEFFTMDEYSSYISSAKVSPDNYNVKIFRLGELHYMTVCSSVTVLDKSFVIVQATDVSEIFTQRRKQSGFVKRTGMISAAVVSLVLLISVILLLRPLSRLNYYTKAIADGNYGIRIRQKGSREFRELAGNMNIMADAVQSNAARLEKAAKDREVFIANLAHEMKTPLTSILGFADLLRIKKNVSDAERAEHAGIIVEETKRLRSLSGKLMELLSIGGTVTEKKPVYLPDMISTAEAALAPFLQKSSVALSWKSEPLTIMADEELFKSLLYNIIENAVKASANGQTIELEAAVAESGSIVISVTDHGIGMTSEEAEKVFEPFYMADKSRSRKAGGAGLGLALCVKIAELHKAVISLKSAPGEGTTVFITMNGSERVNTEEVQA